MKMPANIPHFAYLALVLALLVAILRVSFPQEPELAAGQQADFFECPPNNHVVACVPGTTLTGCEPVGNGITTKTLVDCQ